MPDGVTSDLKDLSGRIHRTTTCWGKGFWVPMGGFSEKRGLPVEESWLKKPGSGWDSWGVQFLFLGKGCTWSPVAGDCVLEKPVSNCGVVQP